MFSDDDSLQKAIDDANSLMSDQDNSLSALLTQEADLRTNYQLLYTFAIGTALAFLCFFFCIVLFRCFAWDKADKVNSYSPQTQKKYAVYTVGSLPIKTIP